ncbi:MAG: hypothetical protein ACJ72W_22210, partial [Actinoallomurus sp.]
RRIQHGATALKLVSHPYPQYLYDLVQHHDGVIPGDLTYRPGPGDLARIDESFRDTTQGDANEIRYDLSTDSGLTVGAAGTTVPAQGTSTAWVTADPGAKWVDEASVPDLAEIGPSTSYKPRGATKETWFAPVQHPRLLTDSALVTAPTRFGNIIAVFGMPGWGDSGGHVGFVFDGGVTVDTSLYQGDHLIGQGGDYVSADVAPDPLPYRLVVNTTRNIADRPYSTRTHTEWGFTSSFTDYTSAIRLPLVQLDYAVATDLSGTAHRRTALTITPSQPAGGPKADSIRTVTVQVSYDDGATWQNTSPRRLGSAWQTQLKAPADARYASLRVSARDTAGNSIKETVVRAFGLR